ncbi:MAG: tetratricopeptide repeat protein [Candidatus Dormibacteria bacterium]
MSVTTGPGRRLPAQAQQLRQPLHQRSQERTRQRWGFAIDDGDAAARAETLLAEAPEDADRLVLVASVRSSRGDNDAALEAARRAVALAPASARAHTTLSAVLAAAGELAEARGAAETAVTLDPADPAVRYNRGLLAWTAGDRGLARDDFAQARAALVTPSQRSPGGFWRAWWRSWRSRRPPR